MSAGSLSSPKAQHSTKESRVELTPETAAKVEGPSSLEDTASMGGAAHGHHALRPKKLSAEKGEGLWLMSFSDMSLILMSFFVLQLAMSAPDRRKSDILTEAISPKERQGSLRHISEELLKEIKVRQLGHLTEVSMDMNGLSIEFKDQALFATGSAHPNTQNIKTLNQVLEIVQMASGNYQLIFEGHTDDVPLKGGAYQSNWELSGARALALLREFKRRGVDESKMSVRSFAHTRPKVKTEGLKGDALKKARTANRRVVMRME